MRRIKTDGGFIICLLINMLFNLEWTIAAWILLGLHFWLRISLWWFAGALGLWFLVIFVWMLLLSWVSGASAAQDKPQENKNPYSAKSSNPYSVERREIKNDGKSRELNLKYDTVLFDLDGTLLNTLGDLANAVNYAMRELGFPERAREEVRLFVGNGAAKLIERSLPQGSGEDASVVALKLFREYYTENTTVETLPYAGIMPLLNELKGAGFRVGVVSNKPDDAVRKLCGIFFGGLVDGCIGPRADVPRKPAPDSVLKMLEIIGSEKDNCLYVGDSETDVLTAQNAGVECVSVTWGFRSREDLLAAGAKNLVDSANELKSFIFGD